MFQSRPPLFGSQEPVDLEALQNENKRTLINQPATHLPDLVVFADHTKTMPFQLDFHAILLFLDISGFTALCEKYSLDTKNGTDQLTKTLNEYMSALVGEIIDNDGDIIKFAGDAILTLWKMDSFHDLKVTVNQVLSCAMNIQKKYGQWMTSVGVNLRVKIGLAAGQVSMTFVGNDEFRHYVLLGRAVDDVNKAENNCTSGDTVASPSIWCHCLELEIEHQVLDDDKHVKIISLELPENQTYQHRNIITVTPSMGDLVDEIEVISKVATALAKVANSPDSTSDDDNNANLASVSQDTSTAVITKVRKAIIQHFGDRTEARKKLYIAKPVLRNIENKQPLEYLSEMRQVSISFINLVIHECTNIELAVILQQAFDVIYSIVSQSHGCLNKIFAFDKGSTYLVVFGLPGFKHPNDSAHALLSSYEIHQELAKIKPIVRNSVGVTTGSTFCGVVGHSHRHEYTVIGRKVNMAARLMMYYPNKVTCDNETYHYSKLSKAHFRELELKKMKGLTNVGIIREYKPSTETHITNGPEENRFIYPILGRDEELELFVQEVNKLTKATDGKKRETIVFSGEAGVGKSRLLEAAVAEVMQRGIKVVTCSLTVHDLQSPFYTVNSLLFDLFEFSLDMSHEQREKIILEMFKHDSYVSEHAYLLNGALQLKFPDNNGLSDSERGEALRKVLSRIITESTKKYGFIVFAIDDAHFMDPVSWEYVHIFGQSEHALVVATFCVSSVVSDASQIVLNHENTLKVTVKGIQSKHIAGLCCQLLGVSMIPVQLERVIREKCSGIPTWCEQLLQEMIKGKILILTLVPPNYHANMIIPPKSDLTRRLVISNPNMSSEDEEYEPPDDRLACFIAEDKSLNIGTPDSIKGMIQARMDHFDDTDQLVVKSAAVLGVSFLRDLLEHVLPQNITSEHCGMSLKRLANSDILICGFSDPDSASSQSPLCLCPNDEGETRPKSMEQCQFVRFMASTFQQTAYQIFLEKTRKSLHIQAAKFLESVSHECTACGGDKFLHSVWLKYNEIEKASLADDPASEMPTLKRKKSEKPADIKVHKKAQSDKIVIPPMMQRLLQRVPVATNVNSSRKQYDSPGTSPGSPSLKSHTSSEEKEPSVETSWDVSEYNQCQCTTLLTAVYSQLVRHWRATGNINKTIHYLLKACVISMSAIDNKLALTYLREVSRIVELVGEDKNPFEGEAIVTGRLSINEGDKAKMYTLMGQALFHTNHLEESVSSFLKALEILGCKQPSSKSDVYQLLTKNASIQWRRYNFSWSSTASESLVQPEPLALQLTCLSHLLHWYLLIEDDVRALNTVLQQLNKAEASTEFEQVVTAYMCMMEYCHILRKRHLGKRYQRKARRRCVAAMEESNPDNADVILLFFVISFQKNLCWGLTEQAVESGHIARGFSKNVQDYELKIELLPALVHILIMTARTSDALDIMQELRDIQEEKNDQMAKAFYHACCLDIVLETGIQVEPYSECMKYNPDIFTNESPCSTTERQRYVITNIALCLLRRGDWNKAHEWFDQLENATWHLNDGFLLIRQFVNILEFRLIELSRVLSVNPRNSSVVREPEERIKKDLLWLQQMCAYTEVFRPRHFHLLAYNKAMFGQNKAAKKYLNKAVKLAKKIKHLLEAEWAEHSRAMWFSSNTNQTQLNAWLEDGDEHGPKTANQSRIMYSLPLPHWFTK